MADDEIPSELIKLALLRLVKSKNYGESKWNLLAGIAHGQSSVEISLGITFDPPTKYRASVCFDELRREGYVVPFENSNMGSMRFLLRQQDLWFNIENGPLPDSETH